MATTMRLRGTVKRKRDTDNYAFLRGTDGIDYFFHAGPMEQKDPGSFRSLREGQEVEFTPGQGDRGPRAIDVQVL